MKRLTWTAAVILLVGLGRVTPAAAQDVVSYWNERALAALPIGRGPTPASIIDLAMVHLAMHDAVQAYDKKYESYAGEITGAPGSNIVAPAKAAIVAAAKAAHDVLVNRFPPQAMRFDHAYTEFLGSLSPAPSADDVADGVAFGAVAASNVIDNRSGDGSFPTTWPLRGPAP